MTSTIRIDFAAPEDFARWQAYIESREGTHCTDLGQWRLFYRDLYGLENYSYLYLDGEAARGAVSLYHFRSPFMGNFLVSTPFFGYGGFYADSQAARDALLDKVIEKAGELGVDYVELRLAEALPPPFSAARDFLEMHLDLFETSERVWKEQLASNVRQNIRRARKSDLEFRQTRDHRPCFELLCRTLRAHGTPFHPEALLKLMRRHFEAETSFSEVWHRNELMAAGVIMDFGDSVITPYIGSLKEFGRLRANYLQYWGIVEHCLERGVPRFELGRSPKGTTHIRFKRKWGASAVEVVYNHLVINPRKRYRNVTTLSPMYRFATNTWRRLPLTVTSRLGPYLARYVP